MSLPAVWQKVNANASFVAKTALNLMYFGKKIAEH